MYTLILHGRRSSFELQKCLNLRVSVNCLQNGSAFSNSFSSAIASDGSSRDGGKGKNFTVSYLVDSLGLAKKPAQSISKKVSFEDKSNPDSVLSLLRSHGFTDSQISSIITDYPLLLIANAEKSLAPKLKFLQSRVASSSELTETVTKVPKILSMKGDLTLSRYYDFAKEIVEADKSSKFEKLCHSLPEGSKQENKIRNLLVLRDLGVPQRLLFTLLISTHHVCCGKEKFEESLKKIVDMGFDPTTSKFVEALCIVYGLSDKRLEDNFNAYKRFGFTVNDIWELFKKYPAFLGYSENRIVQTVDTLMRCGLRKDEVLLVFKKNPLCLRASEQQILNSFKTYLGLGFSRAEFTMMVKCHPLCIVYSAETVKKKTEFVLKKMKWPRKAMTLFPQVLGYSLEKRTVPRCNVIKALISKGLLGSELPPMSSILACTDQAFLNRYVVKHDDKLVPKLMAIFTKDSIENL